MANTFRRRDLRAVGTTAVQAGAGTTKGAYAVPAGAGSSATVIGLTVSNILSSLANATVQVRDAGGNITNIIYQVPIPPGSSMIIVGGDQKLVLEPSESVWVVSSLAAAFDVTMSLLEITP
jgi:hypothetical protein